MPSDDGVPEDESTGGNTKYVLSPADRLSAIRRRRTMLDPYRTVGSIDDTNLDDEANGD